MSAGDFPHLEPSGLFLVLQLFFEVGAMFFVLVLERLFKSVRINQLWQRQ